MSDYDQQFEADLEKAQALSLETLALEEFRRQKLNYAKPGVSSDNNVSVSPRDPPPALPPPPPPRRQSKPRHSISGETPSAESPTRDASGDLISFSSPTSKTAPKGPHDNLKDYIDQLNLISPTTDDTTKLQSPPTMNNPNNFYNNQRHTYPYAPQYGYYYPPHNVMPPPYPVPPHMNQYGVQMMPMPMPNQPYYAPGQLDQSPSNYYGQTRMASPYLSYPPTPTVQPQYNFNTTNMISRPTTPLYPQLPNNSYLPYVPGKSGISQGNNVVKAANNVKTEPNRNSADSNSSKQSSSTGSDEYHDTLSSLPQSLNLIDFGKSSANAGSVRVSVLEAFDPLLTEKSNVESIYTVPSECSSSVYEEYDPLDFLYGETEMRETPVYATVSKRDTLILPSPPPKSISIPIVPAVPKTFTTNKLYDSIVRIRSRNYNSEHKAFLQMVLDVRKKFVHTDQKSNPGYVIAARSDSKYPPNTSIKLLVHHAHSEEPITFTSDVESTVDHVILTVVCSLDEDIREDMSGYMLRVWGANEYLSPRSLLSEYDYVRECVRLEKDVRLCLREGMDESLRRCERDDARDAHLTLDDLVPVEGTPSLNFENLSILFETLEGELSRAIGEVGAGTTCPPKAVIQAVKAICALAGGIETLHITHTLNAFAAACTSQGSSNAVTPEIISEEGAYSSVNIRRATARETVTSQSGRVRDAVRSLVALYCRSHLVDLALTDNQFSAPSDVSKAVPAHTITQTTLFCVEAIHNLPPCWKHDEYLFHAQVYHGTRPLKRLHTTLCCRVECGGFYPRVIFDTWLDLEDMPVNTLPRESRLLLTLYGRTQRPEDQQNQQTNEQTNPQHVDNEEEMPFDQEELGWTAIQLFDYDGMLAGGQYVLPIWPTCSDKRIGPAPHLMDAPTSTHPVVNIEIPVYNTTGVRWSSESEGQGKPTLSQSDLPKFNTLDGHTQSQLIHLVEQGSYQKMPTECREIMWEKRQYLVDLPGALPLILLTATNWYGTHREHLVALLKIWSLPSPLNAMHLLLPCFPDADVREFATNLLDNMTDDEFCRVLPQLTQALRHETYDASPLCATLLRRALKSPRVAHTLFWLLLHNTPNTVSGQESLGITIDDDTNKHSTDCCQTSAWRLRIMVRALLAVCGEQLQANLRRQHLLVKLLSDVAQTVKVAKEGMRQRALTSGAQELSNFVQVEATSLPLGLENVVYGVDIKSCSFFTSNTLPLKINFVGVDDAVIPAMFKVGDDLRQDALVLQIMRVMDTLWLKAGLDLRMVTFQALPTNARRGMIEIVSEAETLRAIQTEWGLTGSFKDKPIAEWLAKHNPSELEYQRARDNFTASCAGYSVATYLLGICDRHNDNIMLKTSGHLFHIDFGKFLGDAQMFGNFKRDRAPFVLTHDMVYVINGCDRPTQQFQHFVELCCMAFNIVRSHRSHILDLISLMATSGVPGVTSSAVNYVRAALLPDAGNAEAAAAFARLIHSSLKNKFTPINFFLHSLAQMRASGDQSSTSGLLSFMPRTYTMAQEGRLVSVECLGYEKRYDPEKHYVYALRIYRVGQSTPFVLYRSYKHFTELYQKICLHFPLAKVHSLPSGLHVGRSNTRQVAERRFSDVQAFLTSLFNLADEIAHSDLVYTFFHPLLRDQQDVQPQRIKKGEAVPEPTTETPGLLKLSIQYTGGVLSVLIQHAQSLMLMPQGLPPNPYVKVYLVPDPTKETKRKTRVLKRNSHPSFMEMLEYRLPIEVVQTRSLQATVWHYDSLQENQFLGGVMIELDKIDLRQETVRWYELRYIPR